MTSTAQVFMNGRGAMDMLIAAHARSIKAVLVTNDLRHVTKVPGLKVENRS